MLRNLSSSYDRLGKYQDQLSTGSKINRPSDDPVIAMKGLAYRTNLMEVEQYKRNFSEAYNWAETTDSALDKATLALQRIRELTVKASNDTYEEKQRESMYQEIAQLKDHLIQIANTQFGEKYLFNGTATLDKPVDLNADPKEVSTNDKQVQLELSKGVYIQVNVDPTKIFTYTPANGTNPASGLFGDLEELEKALKDPTTSGEDINKFLEKIDVHLDNVTNARADMGARLNRIELMEDRVLEQEVTANRILSDNEDADIERVITDLTIQESVHRAALSVGARIIQPSLMDFLR